MRKKFTIVTLAFSLLFLFTLSEKANAIAYTFSGSNSVTLPGSLSGIAISPSRIDDFDTLIFPAGFNYYIDGINYNKVVLSANGWIALVPSTVISLPTYFYSGLPINSLSTYAGGYPLF